jgi:HSP20 family protein
MAFELTPWKPFRELSAIRDETHKIWNRFFREGALEPSQGAWAPALDVSETKDNIVVKAEIPGMDAKNIEISLSGDILTIKGEKKQEKEEKDEDYHLVDRSYGSFYRSIHLPQEVQGNKITAKCKDGILKIDMPKSEKAKAKEIKIKAE